MKHCLVVDDSNVVRKVARKILEDLDFMVSEAENGARALDACRQRMPDVILVDWAMPVMDGVKFLTALRKGEAEGTRPKILFCTTEFDVAHLAKARRAGADGYLMKPFDRDHVTAKLREVSAI